MRPFATNVMSCVLENALSLEQELRYTLEKNTSTSTIRMLSCETNNATTTYLCHAWLDLVTSLTIETINYDI